MAQANKIAAPWLTQSGIVCDWLGRRDYEPVWREMQALTDRRDATTPDQKIGRAHV